MRPGCIADRKKHAELQHEHAKLQLKFDTETRRRALFECLSPLPCRALPPCRVLLVMLPCLHLRPGRISPLFLFLVSSFFYSSTSPRCFNLCSFLPAPCSLASVARATAHGRARSRTVPHRRTPTASFPPCASCAQPRIYIHGPFPSPHTGSLLEKGLHTTLCAKPRVYIYERPP